MASPNERQIYIPAQSLFRLDRGSRTLGFPFLSLAADLQAFYNFFLSALLNFFLFLYEHRAFGLPGFFILICDPNVGNYDHHRGDHVRRDPL